MIGELLITRQITIFQLASSLLPVFSQSPSEPLAQGINGFVRQSWCIVVKNEIPGNNGQHGASSHSCDGSQYGCSNEKSGNCRNNARTPPQGGSYSG